jgi:hypothetical protein
MGFRVVCLFLLTCCTAWPQPSVSSDVKAYLSLTDAQVQSIDALNSDFSQYSSAQQTAYYQFQSTEQNELFKDSPDPAVVGDSYAQMEMIRRDYNAKLAQLQSKVGALLTADQAMLVAGLLNVVRLQPVVSEASCVSLEPRFRVGDFASFLLGIPSFSSTTTCQVAPFPTALANYLTLTDNQIVAIENAIAANQDYVSRQTLKITELQNEIKDLTAAATIDSAKLGADYVAIKQIQSEESTQSSQLATTVRSLINDQQQPQLQALDNALKLNSTASAAVSANILVLPPDLQSNSCGNFSSVTIYDPLSTIPILACRVGNFSPISLLGPSAVPEASLHSAHSK